MTLKSHVTNLYGRSIYQRTNDLKQTKIKLAILTNHIVFMKRCRDQEITPWGLRIGRHLKKSHASKAITSKAESALVREQLAVLKTKKAKVLDTIANIESTLKDKLTPQDFAIVEQATNSAQQREFLKKKESQKVKFERLLAEKVSAQREKTVIKNPVVNISGRELSEGEISVLEKGLGFAPVPKTVPTKEIICAAEVGLRKIKDPIEANVVRAKVASILRNSKPPQDNLTNDERSGLKSLQARKDIKILPADKGNTVVILSAGQYTEKLELLLSDRAYQKMSKDPTKVKERKMREPISRIKAKGELSDVRAQQLLPSHSVVPKLYGVPKIHKPDVPLRPITSTIDSPAHHIARFLTKIISPVLGQTEYTVPNSAAFVEQVKNLTLSPGDILVSFDVTSLFTRVPTDGAIDAICAKLLHDETLPDRCELSIDSVRALMKECLSCSYFQCGGQFYNQLEGAPMGLSLSVALANGFMESFEEKLLETTPLKPKYWRRYVDDTFVVWQHGSHALDEFHQHLNDICPSIQFTREVEENGKLPFLDVEVVRSGDAIKTMVYRKPTSSNVYIHHASHHADSIKTGVIKCLAKRAETVCSDQDARLEELKYLEQIFECNGYPREYVKRALKPKQRDLTRTDQEPEPANSQPQPTIGPPNQTEPTASDDPRTERPRPTYISIPYVKGTSEKNS